MGSPSVSEWLDFMPDTVTISPKTGQSVSAGKPTYGSPVPYPAYVEMKNHLAVDKSGREVAARGRVFLGTSTLPNVEDLLTLPGNFTPTNPPIISVNAVSDETGIHHVTLEIG